MSTHIFSEAMKRSFGHPTFLTIAVSIAIGTSKGIILLFDYQQTLKGIIGQGTAAAECGAVLSLAISADHSTIAAGHRNGSIFTWDLSQPAKPFLHVPPLSAAQLADRKSDGHVADSAILHIGFLGHRHTALVSADESGMAFSHIAFRGLGSLGRSVKTTRILGRYPEVRKQMRRTSVLAFAPLPLGNVNQATDSMGLTALLTPYLLVIISTTPIAQTHLKLPRSKEMTPHSALTGCLAWFPAVRLKDAPAGDGRSSSTNKLVYCWSNILSLLEVETLGSSEDQGSDRIPELTFKPCGLWRGEEAILAVQWMSRSIIAILTITQRLVILTDNPLRVAESSDLNSKHIYHADVFSRQLLPALDNVGQDDASINGVIPDAYYMSFKAYKGRLFLLGANDISLGTLSNWADRLMSLMEAGSPVAAIELATSYYNGDTDKVTIGLPRDDTKRHVLVKDKILKLLSGSLEYLFNDEEHRKDEREMRATLQELARVSFSACFSIGETSFLFDEAYEWFSDSSVQDIFLYELETYIMTRKIDLVPTNILEDILVWYSSNDLRSRLEKILCLLQTDTTVIYDVTVVCMRLELYDALISVWTRAFDDYVTPLIQIMSVIQSFRRDDELGPVERERREKLSMKLFPYLACTLTGRRYPDESVMSEQKSLKPKASIYGLVFSDSPIESRRSQDNPPLSLPESISMLNYPYLRALLHTDSLRFMSMLNEAFEDNFLNGDQSQLPFDVDQAEFSGEPLDVSINRQRIVNILLEVITTPEFDFEVKISLDIFLARNLPKYPQFILLSGSSLRQILTELCNNPRREFDEECQLSVEYLLSTYHPPDLLEFVPLFARAGYFRILKSTYRSSKQLSKWLNTYFEDPKDKPAVLTSMADCLRPNSGIGKRQRQDVRVVIANHISDLADIDVLQTANLLKAYAPDMLDMAVDSLTEGSHAKFKFLQAILESPDRDRNTSSGTVEAFCEARRDYFVRLMCKHDVHHVAEYVGLLTSEQLHLDEILPTIEECGAVDAAIIVLSRNGLSLDAMRRLLNHLNGLQSEMFGHFDLIKRQQHHSDPHEIEADRFLEEVQKYVKVGIWLCQWAWSNTDPSRDPGERRANLKGGNEETELTIPELLWLDLIDGITSLSQNSTNEAEKFPTDLQNKTSEAFRHSIQQAFTSLLGMTSRIEADTLHTHIPVANSSKADHVQPIRFLRILTSFMARLADRMSSISSVRSVLSTIFSAYIFESSMLTLVYALLEKDVFAHLAEGRKTRLHGWGPKSQLCEICKRRAWGPSSGGAAWETWRRRKVVLETERRRGFATSENEQNARLRDKGKGADENVGGKTTAEEDDINVDDATSGADQAGLVVFSCMHIFHRACLAREHGAWKRCPFCVSTPEKAS